MPKEKRFESKRRRAAVGPNYDGKGFYLIRSQCVPPQWHNCCDLDKWSSIDVDTEPEALHFAVKWIGGCPSQAKEEA